MVETRFAAFSGNANYLLFVQAQELTLNSGDIAANSSRVDLAVWVRKNSGTGFAAGGSGADAGGSVAGQGTAPITWSPYDFSVQPAPYDVTIYTNVFTVAHAPDGTGSAYITFGATDPYNFGTATITPFTLALTTIPRQAFKRSSTGASFDKLERLDRYTGVGAAVAQQKLERWNGAGWVKQG